MDKILALFISLTGLLSLYIYSGLHKGKFRRTMFLYYTNISNLIVSIYFLLLFAYKQFDIPFLAFLERSGVMFSMTMIIAATFLVFHFVLVPYGLRHRSIIKKLNIKFVENLLLHYVVPISSIVYWVLYADKNFYGIFPCVFWLTVPTVYMLFILNRGKRGIIEGTDSRYPYPFIDVDRIGLMRSLANAFMLFFVFLSISVAIYFI